MSEPQFSYEQSKIQSYKKALSVACILKILRS